MYPLRLSDRIWSGPLAPAVLHIGPTSQPTHQLAADHTGPTMALTTLDPEIVSLLGGLVTGLLTGLIFERRSTKALARQNKELRKELSVLQATIFSLGGEVDGEHELPASDNLISAVADRARATQDPAGRVSRGALVAYFLQQGYAASDVERVISSLCMSGKMDEEEGGSWLRMT